MRQNVTLTEPPHPECSAISSVTADHSYACEPDTLKRKYQETLQKLDQTQKELLNTKRREKRAKGCVENVLRELKEQQKISEDAQQMLEAYKGLIYCHANQGWQVSPLNDKTTVITQFLPIREKWQKGEKLHLGEIYMKILN